MSKICIWLWLDSSCFLQSVFSWSPRPHPLKLMWIFPVRSRIWLFLIFLSRLGYDYYLYSENLGYAESQVSNAGHYWFFFWRACTYCWDKPFLRDWQKVTKPCSVQELCWGVLLWKSQLLEECAVHSFWCFVRSTWELKQTSVDV